MRIWMDNVSACRNRSENGCGLTSSQSKSQRSDHTTVHWTQAKRRIFTEDSTSSWQPQHRQHMQWMETILNCKATSLHPIRLRDDMT